MHSNSETKIKEKNIMGTKHGYDVFKMLSGNMIKFNLQLFISEIQDIGQSIFLHFLVIYGFDEYTFSCCPSE